MSCFSKFHAVLACVVLLSAGCSNGYALGGDPQVLEIESLTIRTQAGDALLFNVEIADDAAEQRKGMMFRLSMPDDGGMLFLFPDDAIRSFWMKDTLIPLDVLFIRADGEIAHIHAMARPQDHATITYNMPVRAVLELKGGMAGALGIQAGDRIVHPAFRNVLAP